MVENCDEKEEKFSKGKRFFILWYLWDREECERSNKLEVLQLFLDSTELLAAADADVDIGSSGERAFKNFPRPQRMPLASSWRERKKRIFPLNSHHIALTS